MSDPALAMAPTVPWSARGREYDRSSEMEWWVWDMVVKIRLGVVVVVVYGDGDGNVLLVVRNGWSFGRSSNFAKDLDLPPKLKV